MNALPLCTHLLIGFIAGISWYYAQWPVAALLISFALTSGFLCFFAPQNKLLSCALYLTMEALACMGGIARMHYLQSSYAAWHQTFGGKNIAFTATVHGLKETPYNKYPCALNVITKNNLLFQLYIPVNVQCLPGDIITVRSAFITNYQTPNFRRFLQKGGALSSIFLKADAFSIAASTKWSFNKVLFKMRDFITKKLSCKMIPVTKSLFLMILFGYKEGKNCKGLMPAFARWGTLHQLARSGLHLIIFIALWSFLLNCLPLVFIIRQFLLILIIIFYMLISLPSISIIRAFIMFFLHRLLTSCKIPAHPLYIFITTSLLLLIHNPLQFFFLDFQLSFTLTGAIIIFYYTTRTQYKNFKKSLRKYLLFH